MPKKRRAAHHFLAEYSSDNMEISIKHELIVFWGAFFCSQLICIIFDFFRSLRKNTKPTARLVALQDIIFCTLAFKIFFDSCYITNNGKLRWYIFVSFILSMILYFCLESAFVIKVWDFIFKLIKFLSKPFLKMAAFITMRAKKLYKAARMGVLAFFKPKMDKISQFAAKKLTKHSKNKDLI